MYRVDFRFQVYTEQNFTLTVASLKVPGNWNAHFLDFNYKQAIYY